MSKNVITRFAPSPTGYLHIGSARTALYNWLYAKRAGGKMILRIDDTDADRHVEDAVKLIMEDLAWLNIDYEGPIYQSDRLFRYRQVAKQFIDNGYAYPCIATEAEKSVTEVFRGVHRHQNPAVMHGLMQDSPLPLRFCVPNDEIFSIEDYIKGKVNWDTTDIGDPVIMRGNGTPLYNFACAVDDMDLGITHIIRGDEHLSNTVIQLCIYYGMLKTPPHFCHIPYISEPNSRTKLSKRDMGKFVNDEHFEKLGMLGYTKTQIQDKANLNPVCLAYYREMGYSPKAVINYLLRLGWTPDNEQEVMSIEEAEEQFMLRDISKSSSCFDPVKLLWYAGEYTRKMSIEEIADGCLPYLQKAEIISEQVSIEVFTKFMEIVELAGARIQIFSDILKFAYFFRKPTYEAEAVHKCIRKAQMMAHLQTYVNCLEKCSDWHAKTLEDGLLKEFPQSKSKVTQAVMVCITGQTTGIDLFDTMELLGKQETIERILYTIKASESHDI